MSRSWRMVPLGTLELPEYQVEFLRQKQMQFLKMPGLRPSPEGSEVDVTPSTLISGMIEAWMALSSEGILKESQVPRDKRRGRKTHPKGGV